MEKFAKYLTTLLVFLFAVFIQTSAFADDLLDKGEYERAYYEYAQRLSADDSAENNYNMCAVIRHFRDYKRALTYCTAASEKIKADSRGDLMFDILKLKGDIYLENSNSKEMTLEYYKEAEKLLTEASDPYKTAMLYMGLANTYQKYNDARFANDVYIPKVENTIKSEKDEKYNLVKAEIYAFYADYYKHSDDSLTENFSLKALKALDSTEKYKNPALYAKLCRNLFEYYTETKDKTRAREYFKMYAQINDEYPTGADYEVKKKLAAADNAALDNFEADFPYDKFLNIEKGIRCLPLNSEKADEYFARAIKVNPESAAAYLYIASAYADLYIRTKDKLFLLKMKEYDAKAIEKGKYDENVYNAIALLNLITGSYKSADLYYNKYVALSDDKAGALCGVAYSFWEFSTSSDGMKRVISNIESALKISPDIEDKAKMMLIAAYNKIGKPKKAEKIRRKYFQ